MQTHWIWLAHRPGVSDRLKAALLAQFSGAEELYCADKAALQRVEGMTKAAMAGLLDKDLTGAEQIVQMCRRSRLGIVTIGDSAYPPRLRSIPDPPVVLYYKGILPDFGSRPCIGLVGTRKASDYGLTNACRLGYQISAGGGIVVSGLADGIDAQAMQGALSGGQPAVGVLGCGADVVYPSCNRALFERTEKDGCILSEFQPGAGPAKWNFPRRNRIISGISSGVLVIEAPERSGALITANLALDQGRDVFVVPGNIDNAACQGSNRLLRDGAIPVSSGWDVLCEYDGLFPDKLHKVEGLPRKAARPEPLTAASGKGGPKNENIKEKLDGKPIDKERHGSYIDISAKMTSLTPEEQKIVAALAKGERLADEVIAQTGMTTGQMLSSMTMLELKGILRRLPGKRIALTGEAGALASTTQGQGR